MGGMPNSTYEVRVRAVHAVLKGTAITQVAIAFGVDRSTLHRWLARYHEGEGDSGLERREVSGRPRKLEHLSEYNLRRLVLAPATRFGFETDLWTVPRLHEVLIGRYGQEVSEDTVWRRLREAGLTWQVP